MPGLISALMTEALLQKDYLAEKVDTIYFGGGTPSLVDPDDLKHILTQLSAIFSISYPAEVTLEANPDDISEKNLAAWQAAGINRLSIGIQSFSDSDLQWMNRAHTAKQALESIRLTQKAGFQNITIDLIYGTPGLSDETWDKNISTALELNIPHLSCYALTVEPKTALDTLIRAQKTQGVDAEKQARHFAMLTARLAAAGFEHYEISNFARPGFRSRHNSSYWQGIPYLGLGPSAHSFNGYSRQWNIANNSQYISSIEAGVLPFEKEILTPVQQLNEYIMTSLRTIEGCSLVTIHSRWGDLKAVAVRNAASKHLLAGHMTMLNDVLQLTGNGKFLADGIAADLFLTE